MKRTLLAVCGLSPQVITETLYALLHEGRLPDSVHILTTEEGKARCLANLFGSGDGHFYRFLKNFDIPENAIDFSAKHIHTVASSDGQPLHDIAGEEENELFLTACMQRTYELTSEPERAVYFSIAGGRKTMGACLSAAVNFYGRPQDRVFHVLVSPEFESNRDFYYPPKKSREITLFDRDGQPYKKETRYARISLIPMAFVSVRDRLTENNIISPEKPSTLLMSLVREEKPELVIDVPNGTLSWKGVEMDMMSARLALYVFFALLKKNAACRAKSCHACDDCYLSPTDVMSHQERITGLYRKIMHGKYVDEMSNTGITGLSAENFNMYKSKIRKDLERRFGAYESGKLEISSVGKRGDTRYGLLLDQSQIRIII
jgi:CRISPR-associated protein Csx14